MRQQEDEEAQRRQKGQEKQAEKLLNAIRTLPVCFFFKARRDYPEREALSSAVRNSPANT